MRGYGLLLSILAVAAPGLVWWSLRVLHAATSVHVSAARRHTSTRWRCHRECRTYFSYQVEEDVVDQWTRNPAIQDYNCIHSAVAAEAEEAFI